MVEIGNEGERASISHSIGLLHYNWRVLEVLTSLPRIPMVSGIPIRPI